MATFDELVELMRNPAEGFAVDSDFLDTLVGAYQTDMQGVAGQADVLSNDLLQKDEVIAELNATISALKSKNYDLLTQLPSSPGGDGGDGGENGEGEDEDLPDIDDLFGEDD